jgi:N-acetyl-anhydromuramyl-L-alanine amidase AmpD
LLVLLSAAVIGCQANRPRVAQQLDRKGDEIVVAGQLFHTGTRVVLWMDPGGFDAYRTERRFAPYDEAGFLATTRRAAEIKRKTGKPAPFADVDQPERLDLRARVLTTQQIEAFRGGGWDLATLKDKIDQFVYHFDVTGTSSQCFFILQDMRGLSVHFMCDIDGTIYQTCDVKERAWHATDSNHRSVGIEIANIGAYPPDDKAQTLRQWYRKDAAGRTEVVLPDYVQKQPVRRPGPYYPARNDPVVGQIQNATYEMYDFTQPQYDAIIKLTATLCSVLPKITCDYPRDENGKLLNHVLTQSAWENYQGLMGHFHVQNNKQDPGPAFDFEKVRAAAWKLMTPAARRENLLARGHPVHFIQALPPRPPGRKPPRPLRPQTWPPQPVTRPTD